ncbi:MAG: hypothetical protein JXA30_08290 [Deltaproteobacteria bacterium]|nr:hypothetical protein [Deltaproteobacteria bacterium]
MKAANDLTIVEGKKKNKAAPKRAPVVICALIVTLVIAGWVYRRSMSQKEQYSLIPEAPELLERAGPCPDVGGPAVSRAYELEEAALAKLDRYPFHAADGVKGYELLQRARSCFISGNDAEAAMNVEVKLRQWKTRLEQRYQNHLIRLRLALDRDAYADALAETQSLQSLLKGREGAYSQWLASVERRLQPLAQ